MATLIAAPQAFTRNGVCFETIIQSRISPTLVKQPAFLKCFPNRTSLLRSNFFRGKLSFELSSVVSCNSRVTSSVSSSEIVAEPATGIVFSPLLNVPGSPEELIIIGAGVREKKIAFLNVKVYGVALYAAAAISPFLSSFKNKSILDLQNDPSLFPAIIEAPVDKAIQIVLARDVDGAQFWAALDEALVPRLKAASTGVDGEKELAAFGEVFKGKEFKKHTGIFLTWSQPSTLQVSLVDNATSLVPPSTISATIDYAPLVSAIYDVFLGVDPVSPTLKQSSVERLHKLV